MRPTASLSSLALALGLLSTKAAAIAFALPADGTVWDQTGATSNVISWSLWPLTYPTPTSPLFDIYIVNAAPGMYSPTLNTTLALSVDASLSIDTYVVEIAPDLIPGPGYQLFMSAPGNPGLVYADSVVFSVGTSDTPTTGSVSTSVDLLNQGQTSAISSVESSTVADAGATSTSSAEDAGVTSSSVVLSTPSGMATSFVSSATPTSAPSTSSSSSVKNAVASTTAAEAVFSAAPIIGGPADQGFNLLAETTSGAESRRKNVGMAVAGVVAGAVGLAWLF